jgi:hypothetical protein
MDKKSLMIHAQGRLDIRTGGVCYSRLEASMGTPVYSS